MKFFKILLGSIPAFAGILLIILLAVNLAVVQDNFLNYTNRKYQVHKRLSMSEVDLEKTVHSMISYVKGKSDSPQITVEIRGEETEFFNHKEIGHLKDVRVLVKNLYGSMIILFVIFAIGEVILFVKREWNIIRKGIFTAWGIVIVLAATIGITALIDIDKVITCFHTMFLSESKWILNPALDRSVWMFRTKMYEDVIVAVGIIAVVTAFITIGGTLLLTRKKGKRKNRVLDENYENEL